MNPLQIAYERESQTFNRGREKERLTDDTRVAIFNAIDR